MGSFDWPCSRQLGERHLIRCYRGVVLPDWTDQGELPPGVPVADWEESHCRELGTELPEWVSSVGHPEGHPLAVPSRQFDRRAGDVRVPMAKARTWPLRGPIRAG